MKCVSVDIGSTQPVDGPDPVHMDRGNLEWIDRQIRMRRRHQYREVKRDHDLEENALKETIECKMFKARLRPQICMLRKKMAPYKPCLECKVSVQV